MIGYQASAPNGGHQGDMSYLKETPSDIIPRGLDNDQSVLVQQVTNTLWGSIWGGGGGGGGVDRFCEDLYPKDRTPPGWRHRLPEPILIILSIRPCGTNFNEIWIKIQTHFWNKNYIWNCCLQNGNHLAMPQSV